MADIILSGTSAGIVLAPGDELDVVAGGIATATSVGSGALVQDGGTDIDTTASGGGVEMVQYGGFAETTTLLSGGAQIVSSGGWASATDLQAGSFLVELPGAIVLSPDLAGGSLITEGIALYQAGSGVSYHGNAADLAIGSGETVYALFAGNLSSGTVSGGGTELVLSGGTDYYGTVASGGAAYVTGATVSETVSGAGVEFVQPGGVATTVSTTLEAGGAELVSAGGTATDTVLDPGGTLVLLPGATDTTPVLDGGAIVSTGVVLYTVGAGITIEGAAPTGLTVTNGGTEYVLSGGTATATTVMPGGAELVSSGGTTVSHGISSGASATLYSGGTDSGGTVFAGGVEILSGGAAVSATLASSGSLAVFAGGTTTGTSIALEALEQVDVGGTTTGSQIGSSGDEEILGGTAFAAQVGNTGDLFVYSGGAASGATVEDNGLLYVYSGSTSGTMVSAGGQETIAKGTATNTHVDGVADDLYPNPATQLVRTHGTAFGTVLTNGGDQYLFAGTAIGTVISSGSDQYVTNLSVASNTTVSNGGTEMVEYGGTEQGVTLDAGGTAVLQDSAIALGGIDFADTGTRLEIDGTTMPTAVISGFGLDMVIDLADEAYAAGWTATPIAGNQLQVTGIGTGGPLYLQLDHDYTGATFLASPDGNSGTNITLTGLPNYSGAPCYCAGTRIATAAGEAAVEALRIGDTVRLAGGGTAPVVWLGHRHVDCRRHPRPWDVRPVRVAAGAFGADLPRRDLRLSPDHAVFMDGVLIPIRYLINDATIRQEPADAVTYWHVELPAHGVLLAEGLAAESYLDTGNRSAFANGGATAMLHPDFALRVWAAESCARLVRDGAELVAARSVLLERAQALGHVLTRQPALRLRAGGRLLRPTIAGRVHRFRLPAGATGIRLLSRGAAPAHVRDDSDDTRRLGVAVARIVLDGKPIALTDGRLGPGWHDVERDGSKAWRWTNGDAALALAGGRSLDIEVAMTERYWLARPNRRRHAA
jgi:autotransporter passenger strand-loop-strand repeat protein